MVTTRPPKTIVKLTALGPVANTDTKLLIYGLFQKGRVLAQDGVAQCGTHPMSIGFVRWLARLMEENSIDGLLSELVLAGNLRSIRAVGPNRVWLQKKTTPRGESHLNRPGFPGDSNS